MKPATTLTLAIAVCISPLAQAGAKTGTDRQETQTTNTQSPKCADMQGMDMKNMPMHTCKDMMNGKADKNHVVPPKMMTHQATAVVKAVDASAGKVTLAHEAVNSLNWPAMTMDFTVKDRALLPRLTVGKQVHVAFKEDGPVYVIVSVK